MKTHIHSTGARQSMARTMTTMDGLHGECQPDEFEVWSVNIPCGPISLAGEVIPCGPVSLAGEVRLPEGAHGIVLFAHGSGSGRHSPRNQYVAKVLREHGQGTLLFDLLSSGEELEDNVTSRLRFNIG